MSANEPEIEALLSDLKNPLRYSAPASNSRTLESLV